MKLLYMATKRYNRTFDYVFPIIIKYPVKLLNDLQKAEIIGVYLGNKDRDIEGLHIVVKDSNIENEYIIDKYHNFTTGENVVVVRILEKFKETVEYFWKGEYSKMYENLDHIPKTYGNKINKVYHVLANTILGKSEHKKNLIKFNYVYLPKYSLVNNGERWEDFKPNESDFPPNKKEEILNY